MSFIAETIYENAEKHRLDRKLIASIIWGSSGGNRSKIVYEPGFYRRYLNSLKRGDLLGYVPKSESSTLETEKVLRACRIGLMQFTGEAARGLEDFVSDDLMELIWPEKNISVGCRLLRNISEQQNTSWDNSEQLSKLLMAYRVGLKAHYPEHVGNYADNIIRIIESEEYRQILQS